MQRIKNFIKNRLLRVRKEKVLVPCLEGQLLKGRNALITGGTSGIGFAIAESFLKNGADVIITGRQQGKLDNAKEKLVSSTKCNNERIKTAILDLTDVSGIERRLSDIVCKSEEQIDIFVNNAGINTGVQFPNTSEADYDAVLNTNLKGMYFVSQFIVKYMVENEIKGNILNVTSSSALRPAISPYIISKWGERSLTLGMAKKYLRYGIIINGIAPGSTLTPMLNSEDTNDLYLEYSPIKRYIAPEEIGNMATILVSDLGKTIVGDTVYMTGGAGVITFDDMNY